MRRRDASASRLRLLRGARAFLPAGFLAFVLMPVSWVGGEDIREGRVLLEDQFDRFQKKTEALGKVPKCAYLWAKRTPADCGSLVYGAGGKLVVAYRSGAKPCDTGVWVAGFKVADAVVYLEAGPSHRERGPVLHLALLPHREVPNG